MCGIVGVMRLDGGHVDEADLRRMGRLIRHRGPDGEGIEVFGTVGLYNCRLAVIDLKTGHQPMQSDGVTVALNGEIYNYLELRQELAQKGHSFRTSSDTEVLLRSYLHYGPDLIYHLNGAFAFLLYDSRRKILMAARDPLGVKPLYFHATPRRVLFASEVKAFLGDPEFSVEPDWDRVREYLTFQYLHQDGSLFRGVSKVLPGEYCLFDCESGQWKRVRYWEPRFQVDYDHTEKWFFDQIRSTIEDSVRLQMRSDVPVGAFLSGGMDSSLVTILASRYSSGPLHTFTGAFDEGPDFDESGYALEVAKTCGAIPHVVRPTVQEFIALLPRLIWHMDEPSGGPGLFPQYIVSRLARSYVKVCLGGQGGDEVFGGYARYVVAYLEQALKGAILETNDEGEHIVSLRSILPNLPYLKQYLPMIARFWSTGAFGPMDRRYFELVDRSGGGLDLFSEDFRSSFDREALFARFQAVFNHPDTRSYFNKMTHYDLVASLPALLHVEDRVTMAVSLESRVPLLDHRLVDLVARMPPPLKFKGAEMKYALKRAVADLLPPPVLARKDKMGFPVPLHIWARGPARDFFCDVLLGPTCRSRGLFNTKAIERLLDAEAPYDRRLWGLLNLELWFQVFVDRKGRDYAPAD